MFEKVRVLITSVYSLLNFLRVLYALYLELDSFVPGHPAFGSDVRVCVSFVSVHWDTGPATQVGVVVDSSYIKVLPVTSDFLYIGF